MIDFNELVPKVGQIRIVCCPDALANAVMNGDRGVVAEVFEDAVRLRMTSGAHKSCLCKFGAGHTAAVACVLPDD